MNQLTEFAGGHLGFCLAEMLAEIDDQLSREHAVKALAQLDEREIQGEHLEVVCGKVLRGSLARSIQANPLSVMRRKLIDIREILEAPSRTATASGDAKVADLERYRSEKAKAGLASSGLASSGPASSGPASVVTVSSGPARNRTGHSIANAVSGLAMLAVTGFASLSYTSWIGRMPGVDISSSAVPAATPSSKLGFAQSH